MDTEARLKFFKAYSIREAVGEELGHMEAHETLEKVVHIKWAIPIEVVLKSDGEIEYVRILRCPLTLFHLLTSTHFPNHKILSQLWLGGKYSQP